jgi:hypothetical protein
MDATKPTRRGFFGLVAGIIGCLVTPKALQESPLDTLFRKLKDCEATSPGQFGWIMHPKTYARLKREARVVANRQYLKDHWDDVEVQTVDNFMGGGGLEPLKDGITGEPIPTRLQRATFRHSSVDNTAGAVTKTSMRLVLQAPAAVGVWMRNDLELTLARLYADQGITLQCRETVGLGCGCKTGRASWQVDGCPATCTGGPNCHSKWNHNFFDADSNAGILEVDKT